MVQQMVHIASAGATSIRVISDDTDVLLLHFFQSAHLTCDLIMVGTHGVWHCFILLGHRQRSCGEQREERLPAEEIRWPRNIYIGCCFRSNVVLCWMLRVKRERRNDWNTFWCLVSEDGKQKNHCNPRALNCSADHSCFQCTCSQGTCTSCKMAYCAEGDPPMVEFTHGWTNDEVSSALIPCPLHPDVKPAPDHVLKMIRWWCSSTRSCSTAICSCSAARLSCSVLCDYHVAEDCCNE